jgi:hypothetical protein
VLAPLTINRPIPFGVHRDGTPAAARLRDGCAVVVGTPGSGKTIMLQNLTLGLLRCPDCLVWVIDLSRGGLTNPYVGPWRRGLVKHPGIDWVAPDVDEALAMVYAANDIITFRRHHYEEWMWNRNVDKLPASPAIPAITLIIDEGKTTTGVTANQKLLRGLIDIADKGRGMAVRLIMSGLRGTAEVIPSELMADIDIRIGMSVSTVTESNYLFGWNVKPNPRDTPYPGCGLWRPTLSAGAPIPFRSHDLGRPQLLARLAAECGRWRPTLDEPSRTEGLTPELRAVYESRWERAQGAGSGRAQSVLVNPPSPGSVSTAQQQGSLVSPRVHQAGSPDRTEHGLSRLTAGLDSTAVDQAFARAKRAIAAEAATAPDRLDRTWSQIVKTLDADRAAGGEGWRDDPAAEPAADWRAAAVSILAGAGDGGMSGPKLLAELHGQGLKVSLTALYGWLRERCRDGGYSRWLPPTIRSDHEE